MNSNGRPVRSARDLAFLYFSFVAVALIAIHISVYWQTTEDLERLYGQNRLEQIREHAAPMLADVHIQGESGIRIAPLSHNDLDRGTEIVFDFGVLPDWLPDPESLPYDRGQEALSRETDEAYFLMKTRFDTASGPIDALLLMDFRLYELSEQQLFAGHFKQVVFSLLLLFFSLLVFLKISERLTSPISRFASILSKKESNDLEPVPMPAGTATRELEDMVETFNRYQERIRSLLERERSFSRYASHELRTPLTVMRGALTLLEESEDPEFSARQRKRLGEAISEMSELIETLLNLTRVDEDPRVMPRTLTVAELENIAREHEYLLQEKDLTWRAMIEGEPRVRIPGTAFRILLGNLVRNAFRYAQDGEVVISAEPGRLTVSDAGAQHSDGRHIQEGFGLGLLLVRDICRRYGCETRQSGNERGGWTTTIEFERVMDHPRPSGN